MNIFFSRKPKSAPLCGTSLIMAHALEEMLMCSIKATMRDACPPPLMTKEETKYWENAKTEDELDPIDDGLEDSLFIDNVLMASPNTPEVPREITELIIINPHYREAARRIDLTCATTMHFLKSYYIFIPSHRCKSMTKII